MLKSFLQYYLGIDDQSRQLQKIEEQLEDLEEKVDGQEDLGEELQDLKQSFYDSRPLTSELSQRQRELLEIFLKYDQWIDKRDIAEDLDISRNYAGTLISGLRDHVDIRSKKVDSNNRQAYKLSEDAKKRIEQGL